MTWRRNSAAISERTSVANKGGLGCLLRCARVTLCKSKGRRAKLRLCHRDSRINLKSQTIDHRPEYILPGLRSHMGASFIPLDAKLLCSRCLELCSQQTMPSLVQPWPCVMNTVLRVHCEVIKIKQPETTLPMSIRWRERSPSTRRRNSLAS